MQGQQGGLFISTLPLVGNSTATQQCGSEKVSFTCPKTLQAYNEYLGCIDFVDFDKKTGGSFTHKSHFKKLYKKGYLEILDFKLSNSCVAWSMSA